MVKVWFNPDSSMPHQALIVAGQQAYACSPGADGIRDLEKAAANGEIRPDLMGLKPGLVERSALTSIESDARDNVLTLRYKRDGAPRFTMVTFKSGAERDAARGYLQQEWNLNATTKAFNPLQAALRPGIGVLITAFFIYTFAKAAAEIKAGQAVDISGRRSGMKRLVAEVLGVIGPTGVYVVGALLILALLYWMFKRLQNPPVITELKPAG